MDEIEFEVALDRIITETIINTVTKATERQTRIDAFLRVQSLSLTTDEVDALLTETGVIRVNLEAMISDAVRAYEQAIVNGAQSGRSDVQRREGAEKLWTWQVESGRPCPDCNSRDGNTQTFAYWESVGLPRAGTTICGANCKCVLVSA